MEEWLTVASTRRIIFRATLLLLFVLPLAMLPAHASETSVVSQSADPYLVSVTEGDSGQDVISNASMVAAQNDFSASQIPSSNDGSLPTASSAMASSDQVSPNVVFGSDSRVRVTNTTSYPASAIAAVESNVGRCTGFMISKRALVTSAHCVYVYNASPNLHWAKNITVQLGRNGAATPYGTCHPARSPIVPYAYTGFNRLDADYAVIQLDCSSIGSSTGWLGFKQGNVTENGSIPGYPTDKKDPFYAQYTASGTFYRNESNQFYNYFVDTANGQSGAPLMTKGCGLYCAVGVHKSGNIASNNQAVYIAASVGRFFNNNK